MSFRGLDASRPSLRCVLCERSKMSVCGRNLSVLVSFSLLQLGASVHLKNGKIR